MPGSQGGANWQGAVADPESGVMYVSTTSTITFMGMISEPSRSNLDYILAGSRITGPFGLPLARPPWGTIVAIDLNTGKKLWTMANGDTPATVRNHEKLQGVTLPRTGHDDRAGLLVTKTLLFAGEGAGMFVASEGGTKFRAHDKLQRRDPLGDGSRHPPDRSSDELCRRRQAVHRRACGRARTGRRTDSADARRLSGRLMLP